MCLFVLFCCIMHCSTCCFFIYSEQINDDDDIRSFLSLLCVAVNLLKRLFSGPVYHGLLYYIGPTNIVLFQVGL